MASDTGPAQPDAAAAAAEGMQVFLSVYDVTNAPSATSNTAISRLNGVTRELGLGGVFHGAIVLEELDAEFAFGYCEAGSGVYQCKPEHNPMYTFRETLPLGRTPLSREEVRQVMQLLRADWQGASYDLLTRNCCHFCEDAAQRLGVGGVPAWLNRFAQGADLTLKRTQEAVTLVRGIGAELGRVSGETVTYLREQWARTFVAPQQQEQGLAGAAGSWPPAAESPPASWSGAPGGCDAGGAAGQQQQQQQQGVLSRRELAAGSATLLAGLQHAGSSFIAQARQRLSRPPSGTALQPPSPPAAAAAAAAAAHDAAIGGSFSAPPPALVDAGDAPPSISGARAGARPPGAAGAPGSFLVSKQPVLSDLQLQAPAAAAAAANGSGPRATYLL